MPEFVEVLLGSFFSILTLFLLTKAMGNRQMSQLTVFDYIAGISIGSIAAEIASHPESGFFLGILAMAVYAAVTLCINLLNARSVRLRKFFLGESMVLYENGAIYFHNLKRAHLDLTEFLTECRGSGYFDLAKLHMVILEVNGKLSFLPQAAERPLTPGDMNLLPKQERPVISVVMDGRILPQSLSFTGNNETWLLRQLQQQGFSKLEQVFLATVDGENHLAVYEKNQAKQPRNYFP